MSSVFDKKQNRELLSKPAGLQFLAESPRNYPAWNMDWKDRKQPIVGTMDENAKLTVVEKRTGSGHHGSAASGKELYHRPTRSVCWQVVSGKRLEIDNILDWQSTGVSLKAAFPLTVSNDKATYNLGVGTIMRGNNDSLKYEVPAKEWINLTDRSKRAGVTILEDCKYGSDKPDDETIRLTLMYTPATRNSFRYQNTQDWGIHTFRYGLYSHTGNWNRSQTPWQGQFFNRPLLAFETSKHPGAMGKETTLIQCNTLQVNVMAFKKMEEKDGYILRVYEMYGSEQKDVIVNLPADLRFFRSERSGATHRAQAVVGARTHV